jgi:hypothetical protein
MSNRIHLKDYSVEELREMEAGGTMDWLCNQILGARVDEWKSSLSGHCLRIEPDDHPIQFWHHGESYPQWANHETDCPSTKWSAAGRLLDHFAARGVSTRLHFIPQRENSIWICGLLKDGPAVLAESEIPHLAICRAALVLARGRME